MTGVQTCALPILQMIFREGDSKIFKVSGVAKPFPKARTIDFDFLINFKNLNASDLAFDANDWGTFLSGTFIQVDENAEVGKITDRMAAYRSFQNEGQSDWAITSFGLERLSNLHFATAKIRDDISFDSTQRQDLDCPLLH